MKILYHLTVLPPKMPTAEALSQEITALQHRFGGELMYLNPNQHSKLYWPRLLFGFQCLKQLRLKEQSLNLHHFYNPDPYPFPILRCLKKPVIYTVTSGVGEGRLNKRFFSNLAAVAVADKRSLNQLKKQGINNGVLVKPGIDTSRFSYTPCPLKSTIHLMVGSAPWTPAQFSSKGVDALLQAAQQNKNLHLTFLWRGVLAAEMKKRVESSNLGEQVTVINKVVDVNKHLATVHASITLANKAGIVKSYPHSLLDSLAAGKPVLVSQAIPMADYVTDTGCGQVVTTVTAKAILEAVEKLCVEYQTTEKIAQAVGQRDFSLGGMVESYERVYRMVNG